MKAIELKIKNYFSQKYEKEFKYAKLMGYKNISSNTVEILILALAGFKIIPWFFFVVILVYNIWTHLKAIATLAFVRRAIVVTHLGIIHAPDKAAELLPFTDSISASVVATNSSFTSNVITVMNFMVILLMFHYFNVWVGIGLALLFFYICYLAVEVNKEIVDIYRTRIDE